MKSFLKISTFLMVGLFLLVSGVNAGLEQLQHSDVQNMYTLYNEKGDAVIYYHGDVAFCPAYTKPSSTAPHGFLHRIRTGILAPVSS